MNGRTTIVILFFWAVLTIVTPMLVRMSASAKPALHFNGEKTEVLTKVGLQRLLTRRALVDAAPPPAPHLPLATAPPLPLATAPEPSLAIIKPRFGIKKLVQR